MRDKSRLQGRLLQKSFEGDRCGRSRRQPSKTAGDERIGSIDPHVEEMRAGYSRVSLEDRRAVRNHLRSVHAIALVNLAELAANLALIGGLPPGGRMIITGISIDYLKKARGRITAECQVEVPQTLERHEYPIPVSLRDPNGVEVARATVRSLIDAVPNP